VTFPNPKTILKIITHTENNHRYKKEKRKKTEYKQHEKIKNKTKQKSKHSQKHTKLTQQKLIKKENVIIEKYR